MSKAFTKDDTADLLPVIPTRVALPPGVPNYVTPRGLALLRAELQRLQAEHHQIVTAENPERAHLLVANEARRAALETRLSTVELVVPSAQPRDEVRFGAQVTLRTQAGDERRYQLVGVDEADVAHGRVAFIAPLARVLLGRRAGEVVTLRTPRGEEDLEIIAIDYPDAAVPEP